MPVVAVGVVVALGVGVLTGFIWEPIQKIAEALASVAGSVVSLLPDAADLGLDAASGWVRGYAMLNTFLPVTETLAFALIFITVGLAQLAFKVAVTVYHLIPKPGIGT